VTAVAVRLGDAEYGLPMERVREVLRPPPVTRTPFPPPDVLGVIHLRGALLAVLDLGTRLRGRPSAAPGRMVVVSSGAGRERLALRVDRVTGVVETDDLLFPPPPEAEAALPEGWLAGVVSPDSGRLVTLLDLENVLAGVHA